MRTPNSRKYGLIDLGPAASPPRPTYVPSVRPVGSSAKSVGSFLPKLTKTAFEKNGFATVTLLTQWREIAGERFAAMCTPDKLTWPRPSGDQRGPATLTLSVDPAHALDLQYGASQIVERVNGFFGYRAVERVRLVQAASTFDAAPAFDPAPRLPLRPPVPAEVSAISDSRLREALARLSMSVMSRGYA